MFRRRHVHSSKCCHYVLHFSPTFINNFSCNIKFDFGFFNVFLLVKDYIKVAF